MSGYKCRICLQGTTVREAESVHAMATQGIDAPGLCDDTPAVGAVLFADLSGFRLLTKTHGDEAAADTATRFVALVRRSLAPGASVVKTLGDGVLVVAPGIEAARETAAQIRCGVMADEVLPPVHAGICAGSVVWRHGDVFGAAVNDAACLADAAGPWEIAEAAI
jgi:adenylate cyclase